MSPILCLLSLLPGGVASTAEAPRFSQPPTVRMEGGKAVIRFAAAAPTDVEVVVVDATGRAIRHLAAGALGPNAPAPLQAGSLAQAIIWDRTDDAGRPVAGACTVRVGLGLRGELEAQAGLDPYAFRSIVGLAVNAKGELFVLDSEFTYGGCGLRAYSRQGKYLRTLMPYSAALPAGRLAPIGQLSLKDGTRVPVIYNAHGQNLLPYTSGMKHQTMAVDAAGRLVLFSAVGTIVEHGPPRHLLRLEADGGAPSDVPFIGPLVRPARGFMGGSGEGFVRWFDHVAASADGRWLYISGGRLGGSKQTRHAVFRAPAGGDANEIPQPWIGKADESGDDEAHLDDPQGLAVDSAGRLFIADRGNGRIVIHDAGGKRIGQFPAADALQVFIHPRDGRIYVLSGPADDRGRIRGWSLSKYAGLGEAGGPPKLLAHLEQPCTDSPVAALDGGAELPRLYVAAPTTRGQDLLAVTDLADRFEAKPAFPAPTGLRQPMFVASDPSGGKLYVTEFRNEQVQLDLRGGAARPFAKGGESAVDREGFVHVIEGYPPRVFLNRYDPAGRPANFPGAGSPKLGPIDTASKGPNVGFRGHTFAPNGDLYILQMRFYGHGRVVVYGPDGKLKHEALVANIANGSGGIAVDRSGCIYVSGNVKPADAIYPADFAPLLPKEGWVWWRKPRPAPWDRPYYNAYLYHWGSVFKFPAAGGAFHPAYKEEGQDGAAAMAIPPGDTTYRTGYLNAQVGVAGALWRFHGYGPVPSAALNWGDPSCTCMGARFALDDSGRLFVPDVFRFAVNVLDANGNLLTRLGRYGNADDAGLALAWAAWAACGDGRLFLSDMANRRVSVVRLAPAVAATAGVPAAARAR